MYGYASNVPLPNEYVKALHGESQWGAPGKYCKETPEEKMLLSVINLQIQYSSLQLPLLLLYQSFWKIWRFIFLEAGRKESNCLLSFDKISGSFCHDFCPVLVVDFFFLFSLIRSWNYFLIRQSPHFRTRKNFMPYWIKDASQHVTAHFVSFFPQTYAQETFKRSLDVTVLPLGSGEFLLHPGNNFRGISWIRQ